MTLEQKVSRLSTASKLERLSHHMALNETQAEVLKEASRIIRVCVDELNFYMAVQSDMCEFLDDEIIGMIAEKNLCERRVTHE